MSKITTQVSDQRYVTQYIILMLYSVSLWISCHVDWCMDTAMSMPIVLIELKTLLINLKNQLKTILRFLHNPLSSPIRISYMIWRLAPILICENLFRKHFGRNYSHLDAIILKLFLCFASFIFLLIFNIIILIFL
jgi:hypothetical protein